MTNVRKKKVIIINIYLMLLMKQILVGLEAWKFRIYKFLLRILQDEQLLIIINMFVQRLSRMFISTRLGLVIFILVLETAFVVKCAEPNYPEIDDSQTESENAKVDISQESPNSNTIHVAHNIPKNSDINLKQVKI